MSFGTVFITTRIAFLFVSTVRSTLALCTCVPCMGRNMAALTVNTLPCRLRNTSRETLVIAHVSTVRINLSCPLVSRTCRERPWSNCTALSAVMFTTQSPHGTTTLMVSILGRGFPTCCSWCIRNSAPHVLLSNSQPGTVVWVWRSVVVWVWQSVVGWVWQGVDGWVDVFDLMW